MEPAAYESTPKGANVHKDTSNWDHDASHSRIVTCDIYLAAYLLCQGCELERVYRNERRRIAFVMKGNGAKEMKKAFMEGSVALDMRSFRENLKRVRNCLTHPNERSTPCPNQEKNPT